MSRYLSHKSGSFVRVFISSLKMNIIAGIVMFYLIPSAQALNWATEWTQVLNNVQLIQMKLNQIQQLYNDATMIRNQIESLKSIASYKGNWQDVQGLLMQMDVSLRQAQGISEQVQEAYQRTRDLYPVLAHQDEKQKSFENWYAMATTSSDAAMALASNQNRNIDQETQTVQALLKKSDDAAGQTQALQTMNRLMAELIRQMQELRQLNAAQIAQLNFLLGKKDLEKDEQVRMGEVFHEYEASRSEKVLTNDF